MKTHKLCILAVGLSLCCAFSVRAADSPETALLEAPSVLTKGDLVTLNVNNVDISAILRLLGETRQVSIVAGPDVTGPVTVNLYDVPFEQALEAILGISGFTHYRKGDVIFVTSADNQLNLPPTIGQAAVQTFRINHAEPEQILETVQQFITPHGKAMLSPGKVIVVRDDPFNIELIAGLVHSLDTPPRQVMITAKLVNIERDNNRDIGVGFDTLPFTKFGIEALASGFARYINQPLIGNATGYFFGTAQSGYNVFLEALERKGDVDILASPSVLVLDGEQARIQIGERLGFRITTTTQTSSLESVEFLDVGTLLEVTPSISDEGLIKMLVNPKVSNGSIDANGLPSENTTELNTTMLVNDGETIVIGGLLNATKQHVRSQIPILGDIPYLGKLFGHNTWIDDKSELVILLTPHIVGPYPTLAMNEKIEAAETVWGEFGQLGHLRAPEPEDTVKEKKRTPTARKTRKGSQPGRY